MSHASWKSLNEAFETIEWDVGDKTVSVRLDSFKESLYLQEKHTCNDLSSMSLIPPHKGTDGWVKGEVGQVMIRESKAWVLEMEGESLEVDYCPWCGEHLSSERHDLGKPEQKKSERST